MSFAFEDATALAGCSCATFPVPSTASRAWPAPAAQARPAPRRTWLRPSATLGVASAVTAARRYRKRRACSDQAGSHDFLESLLAAAVGAPIGSEVLSRSTYDELVQKAQSDMVRLATTSKLPVTLDQSGNAGSLYGEGRREYQRQHGQLKLGELCGIIDLDIEKRQVTVGCKTDFKTLTRYLLRRGLTVPVVPEIDTVTVGGAIAGVVMESGSFRHGFVHNTVSSMDVLLPDGNVVSCSREINHDLFAGIPHSYGTLGYVLSATLLVVPATQDLTVTVQESSSVQEAVDKIACAMEDSAVDFIEGIIFSATKAYTITASMRELPEAASMRTVVLPDDGRFINVLQQHLEAAASSRGGAAECSFRMSTYDYLWRWDCDMFWATRRTQALGIPWVRKLLGRAFLRSKVLWVIGCQVRSAKEKVAEVALALLGSAGEAVGINKPTERIIQDLGVRFEQVPEFAEELALHAERPFWMCPVKCKGFAEDQVLFPLPREVDYMIDVASFGAFPRNLESKDPLYHNRCINRVLEKFDGLKPFYSDVLYTEEYVFKKYGGPDYERLKAKFDANNVLPHIFNKVVTA